MYLEDYLEVLEELEKRERGEKDKMLNYESIKKVIDKWDPIELFDLGCPEDEYDIEVKELCAQLRNDLSVEEVAKIIYDIFIHMFGSDTFTKSLSECKKIAVKILSLSTSKT